MMLTDQEIDALWPDITLPQKVVRREILRKGIAANNAKVLADLKPVVCRTRSALNHGWDYFELAPSSSGDLYDADTVAAIIQARDSLAARVKELNDLLAKSLVTNMQLKATP